ncbi:uncharacterized protein [Haliotis asinina]|uniref:uncharacterized protein n=1 Tax=Haliotis asinina TaxID=109174 RepID=UPI0035319443
MTGLICGILLSWAALCASSPSFLARRQASIGGCDQVSIMIAQENCYGPLMNVSQMQPPSGDNVFNDIEASCRDVAEANICFEDEMKICGKSGRTLATMMANTFEYVCGEGLEIMLSESDCWAHENFTSDILECSAIMEAEFARLGYNGFCSVTNNFIWCIGERIQSKTVCSEEAAWFVQELFRRSIRPAADLMSCRLHTRAIRAIVDVLRRK